MFINRRDLLKKGSLIALGTFAWPTWMPRMAFRPAGSDYQGDTLVCIFQRGGMDGLNVVVPHGDAGYYQHRDALAIARPNPSDPKAALDLDGFFGLHPVLAPLKDLYDHQALAVVHAAGSPDPTHSHFDAMDYMERGTPGEKQIPTGWLGRHLQTASSTNSSPFRAVGLTTVLQQSLRGPVPAVALQSIADFHLKGRQDEVQRFQSTLAALYNPNATPDLVDVQGRETFEALDILDKIQPSQYTPSNGAQYPDTLFGKSLMTVAQLIKAQIGLEIACVDIGGWDTHVGEGDAADGTLPRLLGEIASGLAAFYADLQDRMSRITVVTMSEFGRRVQENSSHGTDHGHGNAMFLMGGGVNGGKVYAEWPGLGQDKLYGPGDLAVTTDFRDVLAEIVQKRLLNKQVAAVFPNYTPKTRGALRPAGQTSFVFPWSVPEVEVAG